MLLLNPPSYGGFDGGAGHGIRSVEKSVLSCILPGCHIRPGGARTCLEKSDTGERWRL